MSQQPSKYFVGFLLEGTAAGWHIDLAKHISEKFQTWELHKKIPPHVTIFRPFTTDAIEPIKTLLKTWAQKQIMPGTITLSGFDHFEDRVVFVKVHPDETSERTAKELQQILRAVPGMPAEDFPIWHPHATVANHLSATEINQIWEYMCTLEAPTLIIPFNNITLFRFVSDQTWVVEESFRLNLSGSSILPA